MPIILNTNNISVQYNTGSNYIIETVKTDVFVRDTVGTTSNLYGEPTTVPSITPTTPTTPERHKLLTFNALALLSTASVADSAIAAIRFETLGFSDAPMGG